jgi:hypothetical protein
MDADARAPPALAASDGEGGAERAPLRATDPVSAVSPKMARSGENGQLDRASSTIATVRLRLDVLTSQNRALNVSLRDLAALHTKTSAERDALRAALREAETERDAVSRRAMALEVGDAGRETIRRALAAAASDARIADEHASEAASQVAGAVAVAAEADARANLAEAEVETLKAKLALADAERAERSAAAPGTKPSDAEEEEEEEEEVDEDEDVRFGRGTRFHALQLARVKDQHVAALRVGELEVELERAETAAAVFEAQARDAEREKESADEKTAAAFEAIERLRRENDELRVAGAAMDMDGGVVENDRGQSGGVKAKTKTKTVAAELSALRAAATRLARDVCEAAEFGLAASAVDVPRNPPGAPDGEGAPAAGEATFWYDAARNEIRLLL